MPAMGTLTAAREPLRNKNLRCFLDGDPATMEFERIEQLELIKFWWFWGIYAMDKRRL